MDKIESEDVVALLNEHLCDMHANSPPESIHAFGHSALVAEDVSFWVARHKQKLAGCVAIKWHTGDCAELKSMRTHSSFRGKGIAKALLEHVIEQVKQTSKKTLRLETGSQAFFAPARNLYKNRGFIYTGPFGDYKKDPNSCFMCLHLDTERNK